LLPMVDDLFKKKAVLFYRHLLLSMDAKEIPSSRFDWAALPWGIRRGDDLLAGGRTRGTPNTIHLFKNLLNIFRYALVSQQALTRALHD